MDSCEFIKESDKKEERRILDINVALNILSCAGAIKYLNIIISTLYYTFFTQLSLEVEFLVTEVQYNIVGNWLVLFDSGVLYPYTLHQRYLKQIKRAKGITSIAASH